MTTKTQTLSQIKQLLDLGRLGDAEAAIEQMAASSHELSRAFLMVGIAMLKSGKTNRAVELLQRSLSAEPTLIDAMNWLSVAHRLSGRLDEAEVISLRAVELDRRNPLSLCNLGLVYLHKPNGEKAVEYLEQAVALAPQEAQFRHNFGLALQSQGRDLEAAQQYRAALTLMPAAVPSLLAFGGLMLKFGNAAGALESARQVLGRDPSSISANLLAARALANLGEEALSETHVRSILQIDPGNSAAHAMLGFRLQAKGDFAAAEASFRKSIELNPHQGVSYWGLRQGNKAAEQDRPDLAKLIGLSDRSDIPDGERAYLFFTLAKSHADLRDFESAITFYDRANTLAAKSQLGSGAFDEARHKQALEDTKALMTPQFLEANRALATDDATPIFIVGMMRSGTTLMEQILSSHPEVSAGGELRFWLERGPRVVDTSIPRVDPKLASTLIDDYRALLTRIAPTGRVTDKMPENSQVLGLIHLLFPNAKIIHMNRHPVDVCLSIYTTPYEISPDFAHVRENIVFACRQHEALMAHWRAVLPQGSFLDVRYEQLVDSPEATIREILDFCELPWDERCLNHGDNTRAVNTPSVWQVRQPIYSSSRGKWRQYEPWLGAFADLLENGPLDV